MLNAKQRERLSYGLSILFHVSLLVILALCGWFTFRPPAPAPVEVELIGGGHAGGGSSAAGASQPASKAPNASTASADAIMEYVEKAQKVFQEKAPNDPALRPTSPTSAPGTANGEGQGTGGSGHGQGTGNGDGTGDGSGSGDGSGNGRGSGDHDGDGSGSVVAQPARLLHRVDPIFPEDAINRDEEAVFTVQFTVDSSGRVSDIEVLSANVPSTFVRSLRKALLQWRYEPAHNAQGVAIPSTFTTTVQYQLVDY